MISQQEVKLDTTRFESVIFDCDGVLVDSEPHSCFAWNVLFENKYNVDIGKDYSAVLGKSGTAAAKFYCDAHGISWTEDLLHQLSLEKEEIYYSLARSNLKPMPGVISFIQKAESLKFKIAVASSGSREKILFNLKQSGLWSFLQNKPIIDCSMVTHGKPDPEIFFTAAQNLGVDISRCIIIEDSIAGIQAAKQSGAYTIALTSAFPPSQLNQTQADVIISDFSSLEV